MLRGFDASKFVLFRMFALFKSSHFVEATYYFPVPMRPKLRYQFILKTSNLHKKKIYFLEENRNNELHPDGLFQVSSLSLTSSPLFFSCGTP